MRIGIFIVVLILATVAGIFLRQDPGYALLAYKGWTVEMPLWLMLAAVVCLVIVLLVGSYVLKMIFSTFDRIKTGWYEWHKKTARHQTAQGLLELAKGRWHYAERFLVKSAPFSDTPLINYLSAAKAAEEGGSLNRRDQYLRLASECDKDSNLAVLLTKAQLQLKAGQLEESLAILKKLHHQEPKNTQVLKYLCMVYETLGDYSSVLGLLPVLRKEKVFKTDSLDQLEIKAYQSLLPKIIGTNTNGIQHILAFWKQAPASIQSNSILVAQYCSLLINQGLHTEADNALKIALKKGLDNHLIYLYGLIRNNPKKQLAFAESFLEQAPQNPVLLLTLGKLTLDNQLWGKAKDYLEKSISLKPTPEAYRTLAKVYDQMELPHKRDECYKQGLDCATEGSIFLESLVS